MPTNEETAPPTSAGGPPGPEGPRHGADEAPGRQQPASDLAQHVKAFVATVRKAANRRRVYLLIAAVVVVVGATTIGQIRLNAWQRDFYDALNDRHLEALLTQTGVFVAIVAVLLALGVAQTWLREILKINLRDAVSSDILDEWLQPRRAYQLTWAGDVGRHPDQRIQEDSRHLCELCADLGIGLLQSALLLVSFVGVLWVLSEHVVLVIGGRSLQVPGYMVWCALAYAIAGSWATWRVGRPLIALNAERYAREADFRFSLVHVDESAEAIGLYGGEREARIETGTALVPVLAVMRRLARGLANLTWVTAGYGWLTLVVPIIVAAPGYFNGTLSFGQLMMVTGAFFQVQQSLRWFVDNFSTIADWRATLLRVMSLRLALPALEADGDRASRIEFGRHPAGTLMLDTLEVALPDKRVRLKEQCVEMAPGDRLVIIGAPGSGKSMLFRAVAGLWPWGSGRVLLPQPEALLFLPNQPYLPLGTLREAVAFPFSVQHCPDAEIRSAIERVGLGHLLAKLDVRQRWDKELRIDEQQRLAFARLLVHRPKWVIMDDPLSAVDHTERTELCGVLNHELAGSAVIAIGRSAAAAPGLDRVVELVEMPDGDVFRPPMTAVT
ncbi:ABC transporter ATP-binding protein/permease [Hartmannibacter diazotrophicus]|uniref:ABC transporter ATP-binding protein/permease n=1 Tax=Hartmannibacter diazotrophicus TaxID=1482074 RepID=UPI00139021D4|nr:ABC transporter ATP-binding protein/permease [Hartmannibacter diazotrophicus]